MASCGSVGYPPGDIYRDLLLVGFYFVISLCLHVRVRKSHKPAHLARLMQNLQWAARFICRARLQSITVEVRHLKITAVSAVYPNYRNVPASWRTHFWQIVVRVETDAGVTGFGYGGGGRAAVEVVNRHFSELVVGSELGSVGDISAIWDHVYAESLPYGRKGVAVMALSGLDLALWDALGKAEAKPVYDLLGGASKGNIRSYATGADQSWYGELGFTATKFPHRWTEEADYDSAVERASMAREVIGGDGLVMIDTYMSWDSAVTRRMTELLKQFNIYWFEDVCTPDELDAQAQLRSVAAPVLIAGGEHEFTHFGFAEIARAGALDLWQPDITWCGGITAGLRILNVAAEAGIPVAPHRGGEVWGLHLIAASDCMDLAEVLPGTRDADRDDLWIGEPTAENGYIAPSDSPGFGVRLNEDML